MNNGDPYIGKIVHYWFQAPGDSPQSPFRGPRAAMITGIHKDSNAVDIVWFVATYTNYQSYVLYNEPKVSLGGGMQFWLNVPAVAPPDQFIENMKMLRGYEDE
jgi:hypothetical protein